AYLFIPDCLSGKYTKIQVSQIAGHGSTTDAVGLFKAALVQKGITWGTSTYADIWNALPFVADGDVPTNGSSRDENGLTVHSDATLYAQYKGDICKFMSTYRSTSGLSGKWRLPVSSEFGPNPDTGYYIRSTNWSGSFSGGISVDGTDIMTTDNHFWTFSRVLTGTDEPSFPASGIRSNGNLLFVGNSGYCWSSSAYGDSFARILFFGSGSVGPGSNYGRTNGFSTRCVRE
ncbi:MAG: fibrobacter succinogenes major paralogous domain-containing protein, partial [Prevotella sp.]|nr:fibrobacter succinogenes major paralogous domain-containing protein [Prevotella sp.]